MPFRRGVKKQGGMPADFDPKNHGLRKLKVARRHGVIFASFASDLEPLEEYFGPSMLALFDRVFDGRELRVLGYSRQLTPANWKLMFENIKDPYHASLLHVFLVSFGLFRADQPSKVQMDSTGRHGALISWRGDQKKTEDHVDMKSLIDNFKLQDAALLEPVREFPEYTVVMTTLWPNLIIQQQSNTLAMRARLDLFRLRRRRRGHDTAQAAAGEPHGACGIRLDRRQRSDEILPGRCRSISRRGRRHGDGRTRLEGRAAYGHRIRHPRVLLLLSPGHGDLIDC